MKYLNSACKPIKTCYAHIQHIPNLLYYFSIQAQLCITEVEKWKLCLVGSQEQTRVVNAVETCEVQKAMDQLFLSQQRCIPYIRFLNKRLFGQLNQAGECLLNEMSWQNSTGSIITSAVKFATAHMPVALTEDITMDSVRQCAQEEMEKLNWKLAGCNYKKKQKNILTNKYKDIMPLKCFLHILGDACAEVAKEVINIFAAGFLSG